VTSQCFTGGMVLPESAISVQHDANDSGTSITKSPLARTRRLRSLRVSVGTLGSAQSQEATADASGQARDVASDNARAVKLRCNSRERNQNSVRAIRHNLGNLATPRAGVRPTQKGVRKTGRNSRATTINVSFATMGGSVSGLAVRFRRRVFKLTRIARQRSF
jgi:hypothetical protein